MNVHESEKIAGILRGLSYVDTAELSEADIIVFNTCCIRENAENHAFGNIGALKKLKKQKPNLLIAVGGCMTQEKGKTDVLKKKFPFIDIMFGTLNLEELGDLMLQVIFHSIMGKEEGNYNLETVIGDICKKLIRRHPHIFASVEANTTNTVLENWDNIKNVEKSNKTLGDELSSITSSLPALMRSEKVCKKIRKRKGETFGGENITMEEAGEALFKLVASCSVSGINPEEALKKYTEKIIENNQ